MRLVWSLQPDGAPWRQCEACREAFGYCPAHAHVVARNSARSPGSYGMHMSPLVGPRMRLPQAKDVPEDAILRVLTEGGCSWYTHWRCHSCEGPGCQSLPCRAPELAAFPVKVLVAKLASMRRRGLVDGDAHARHRGDWRFPPR